MTVKLVKPIEVNDVTLKSSTIPEPDPAQGEVEWEDRSQLGQVYNPYDPQPSNDFDIRGIINANNGFVYMQGDFLENLTSYKLAKINKSNDAVTYIASTRPFPTGVTSYFYEGNGKIYMLEQISASPVMVILDTSDDSIVTNASPFGTYSYQTANSIGDGFIYFAGGSTDIGKYDVDTDNGFKILSGQVNDITCSAVGFDEKIYFGDFAGNVQALDTSDDSIQTVATIQDKILECVYAGGDDVFFFTNGGFIHRYSISSKSISSVGKSIGRAFDAIYSSVDGFVYFYASDSLGARVNRLDPDSGEVITLDDVNSRSYLSVATDEFNYVANINQGILKLKSSYVEGDEAALSSTHKVYKAATSTLDNPSLGASKIPPTWTEVRPTNRWAIFDSSLDTKTLSSSDFDFEVDGSSGFDTAAILGMSGVNSVTVYILDQVDTVLYTETRLADDPSGLYPGFKLSELVFEDLPPFSNSKLKVTISGSNIEVGGFVYGQSEFVGKAVDGTTFDTKDYSSQEFDEFGNITYKERPIVPYHTYQIDVLKSQAISVARRINSYRGQDILWIGDIGGDEPLVAFGRVERFPMTFSNPTLVSYTAKVRGAA